jgi:hypothetical protein
LASLASEREVKEQRRRKRKRRGTGLDMTKMDKIIRVALHSKPLKNVIR